MNTQIENGPFIPFQDPTYEAYLNLTITGEQITKEVQRALESFGITAAQFTVLLFLSYRPENKPLNQTDLGNLLFIRRSNVTTIVNRMVRSGWIRRIPDTYDRRVNYLELTQSGTEKIEQASDSYFACIHEIMAGFSSVDFGPFKGFIEKIHHNLHVMKHK